MSTAIYWFRNDLRLYDNPALAAAIRENEAIVPVYIIDERHLQTDSWGLVRTAPYRLQFLLESLTDLQNYLQEKGSNLLVYQGIPALLIPQLAAQYGANRVYATREYTHEELEQETAIGEQLDLRLYHGQCLYHPADIPFAIEQLPDIFTQFRKRVEKYSEVRELVPSPEKVMSPPLQATGIPRIEDLGFGKPALDPRAVLAFKGGALAGEQRLEEYLWDTDLIATYKQTRNGLMGADYSTKFSAWLANGCISPRTIYHEIADYEAERAANDSTYWVKFELLWRDYFKYVAMKYGRKIFYKGGIQDKKITHRQDHKVFQKWTAGQTGDDFVDANMRELLHTGFMSNRGRQNVASYLVHQLRLDWRMGAAWFESQLIDYDVASNYGNWMYAAGVGNDPRDRVFNTRKQASNYDPQGAYRQLWLND